MWEKMLMMSVGALGGWSLRWIWFMKILDNELTKWEEENKYDHLP